MISFDLTGKVAVVTGASSGLGQQFARALSEQGCDVAILARRKERLEEFSKELKQNGQDCLPVSCDVTDEETVKEKKESISRQTIEIADRVVDKQMRIVQDIASLLGETAAETKIALYKLKESISNE